MMSVTIELPEEIEQQLAAEWGNLPRRALEALAIEGYRTRALTRAQVRQMLKFQTRMEVDELMKRAGVTLDYAESDLEHDRETHHRLRLS